MILTLKIVSDAQSARAYAGADIDGDRKIGLSEAIYVLELISERRRD